MNEPTEWVNRLVNVEKKNGSMRLCLDPRDLNENIIREYCVIPTLSDLSSKLKNARVFSVFDLKDGFWQIKLDLESSKYYARLVLCLVLFVSIDFPLE